MVEHMFDKHRVLGSIPRSIFIVTIKIYIMEYQSILVIIAFAIYLIYDFTAVSLFGTPKSLSNTFYLFKERKSWQRFFFPIMMISTAGLLLPAWLDISQNSPFQFLSFLACAGIMFTGAAPTFKASKMENRVHMISAIIAAVCAILWIILVTNCEWVIGLWFIGILVNAIVTKTIKTSYIYHLETIAFMSTFCTLLLCL